MKFSLLCVVLLFLFISNVSLGNNVLKNEPTEKIENIKDQNTEKNFFIENKYMIMIVLIGLTTGIIITIAHFSKNQQNNLNKKK